MLTLRLKQALSCWFTLKMKQLCEQTQSLSLPTLTWTSRWDSKRCRWTGWDNNELFTVAKATSRLRTKTSPEYLLSCIYYLFYCSMCLLLQYRCLAHLTWLELIGILTLKCIHNFTITATYNEHTRAGLSLLSLQRAAAKTTRSVTFLYHYQGCFHLR